MDSTTLKGYAYFGGAPSVGINPYSYDFEIPNCDVVAREEVRAKLVELYNWLDGESTCYVVFGCERDEDLGDD
jgi:hypothetical protein